MGHRVVGGVAVGAAGVIGSAYGMAVGLEPRTITGSEGASVRLRQQSFGWVNWSGSGLEHFVGCLRPDYLLYPPASKGTSG